MEYLMEFLMDLIGEMLGETAGSKKAPKVLRSLCVCILCLPLAVCLFTMLPGDIPTGIPGKLLIGAIAVSLTAACVYLNIRIWR